MSIGMLTVLKTIPWADVIGAAPGVVGGARKLWDAVANKPTPQEADTAAESHQETVASLSARLTHAEAALADLHQQLVSATSLIASLADQNATLIVKVETGRKQTAALAVASVVALVLAVTSLVVLLVRT